MSDEEPVRTSRRISAALRRESLNQAPTLVDSNQEKQTTGERADAELPRALHTAAPVAGPHSSPVSEREAFYSLKKSLAHAGSRKWLWVCIVALIVAATGWAAWRSIKHRPGSDRIAAIPAAPDLVLTLHPKGQDLMLEWTSNLPGAKQVRVDVFDGDSVRQLDSTNDFQRPGGVPIAHKTGNVQVVAKVMNQSGSVLVRTAGFTDSDAVLRDEASTAQSAEVTASSTNPPKNKQGGPHHRTRRKRR